jgi:hypothetical protein
VGPGRGRGPGADAKLPEDVPLRGQAVVPLSGPLAGSICSGQRQLGKKSARRRVGRSTRMTPDGLTVPARRSPLAGPGSWPDHGASGFGCVGRRPPGWGGSEEERRRQLVDRVSATCSGPPPAPGPWSQQPHGQLGSVHSGSQSQHKIVSMGVTSCRSLVGTSFPVAVVGSVGTAAPRPWRPSVRAVR